MTLYKYLFFDVDGTITQSEEGIKKSYDYALTRVGVKPNGTDPRKIIGPPIKESFIKLNGLSSSEADVALGFYRERFAKKGIYQNKLYDGILELLKDLKKAGYIIATATSKPEEYTIKIAKEFGFYDYIDVIAGASLDATRITKEAVLEYVIKRLNLEDLTKVLMIGDTKYDLIGAANFNIDAVGVTYGYGTKDELCKFPHVFIADSVEMLRKFLLK